MGKLINDVQDVLDEQLTGLVKVHLSLILHQGPAYVTRADAPIAGRVALLSGGGSGYKPMHCSYIGQGMLSGACPDEIFTSSTSGKIFGCAIRINNGESVPLIIKNYTGDTLNSETVTELLHDSGVKVIAAVIDDDVVVKDGFYTTGRRDVANIVLIEKLVGAAARRDDSLGTCTESGRKLNNQSHSIGIALGIYAVPAAGKPSFTLADSEMEFGIGIYGEPDIDRRLFSSLSQTVDEMFGTLLGDGLHHRILRFWGYQQGSWQEEPQIRQQFQSGDRTIALVSNLGAIPLSELYGVYNHLTTRYQQAGLTIEHNLIGAYCTLLDMIGFSAALLKVDGETLVLWDAPIYTPALNWGK